MLRLGNVDFVGNLRMSSHDGLAGRGHGWRGDVVLGKRALRHQRLGRYGFRRDPQFGQRRR